ncbi:MAG: hypothetical protein ACP5VF_13540 [Acidobacteriota bacterium]
MTQQQNGNRNTTTNGTASAAPKARPAWEVFFVGEDGKVIERAWEDKERGTKGTTWDRRGALWADTTKDGAPVLRGVITLLDGTEIRLKLVAPRPKKDKVA